MTTTSPPPPLPTSGRPLPPAPPPTTTHMHHLCPLQLTDATNEAKENVKYLTTLEHSLQPM